MKKISILAFILLVFSGFTAYSQTALILAKPMDSKDWGYCDLKGEFIIIPQYKNCTGFSLDGFAAIYDAKMKQYYFITTNGETLETEIKDFRLQEILGLGMKGFQDGFAPVRYQEKWGFLNTDGKLAIPAQYDKVTQFNSGYAVAQKVGKYYILDKTGNEIMVDIGGLSDINEFSEGYAIYKLDDGNVGFIDGNGTVVIPAKYKAAGDFSGGLAWAKDITGSVGYIDKKGEWVIPPKFEAGKFFDPSSGLARVKLASTWAYTNRQGDLLFVKDTEVWEDFFDGLAKGKKNGMTGFFNAKGEWVIEPQFDNGRDFHNGYASVKKGDKWGVIDTSGKWVIEPTFDEIKDVEIVR
jgi:hypothetical protein